jgi:type 1 glutamine amidotransferase
MRTAFKTLLLITTSTFCADPWVEYRGGQGPGHGKKVVLISGDEEYRSEETLTQLGRILATRHGFDCTVLYAIDPADGTINPNVRNNIPGLSTLKTADLMIIETRYRDLPDDQMKHIVDYIESGRPIIGIRTATHAFKSKSTKYAAWDSDSKEWPGGFGRQILGECWVNHHGSHGKEGTRGRVIADVSQHPILRGIKDGSVFGPSDVYGIRLPMPADCMPLLLGEVTATLDVNSPAVAGTKNDPMMPIAWTKTNGSRRVFATTLGASQDFANEGLRRLLVNASYWAVGLEESIPSASNVAIVGEFRPSPFRTDGFKKGVKPADLAIK